MDMMRLNGVKKIQKLMGLMMFAMMVMSFVGYQNFEVIASEESGVDAVAETQLVYFYTQGCKDCEAAKAYMSTMDSIYEVDFEGEKVKSEILVAAYDISSQEGLETMYAYFDAYDVPEDRRFVPSMFVGDQHIMGADEFESKLVKTIQKGYGLDTNSVTEDMIITSSESITLKGKDVAGVLLTGLVNGFNPCSISMILFLFSLLLARNVNVLKLGFAFIVGKFITYVLLGSVFYNLLMTFNIDWLNTVIKYVLIVVFLLLSIMNILDFVAAKNENYGKIKMQLPSGLRKMNHTIIKKITNVKNQKKLLLMCFVLGVVISVGEFLCTGQIYLATIVYVLQNSTVFDLRSFTYLVLYSLAFIVPLVVITIIIHKSKSYFNLSEFVRGKMHLIKLLNAIVFFLFMILVIFWY